MNQFAGGEYFASDGHGRQMISTYLYSAGILLDIPLDHSKELKRLTLETLSNDVVIGIMGITLQ